MATIRLYLDTRGAGEGDAPLKISITQDSKTALLPTGVRIPRDCWDRKAQAVVGHPNRKRINSYVASMKLLVERELYRLAEMGRLKGLDATQIKDEIDLALHPEKRKERDDLFPARFERFVSLKSAPKTVKGYRWTLKALREFDPGFDGRTFEEVGVDYLKDFVAWCTRKGLNRNSVNIHLRYVRAVFNDAIDAGVTSAYPFRSVSIRPLPVRKKALTIDQLRTLFSYPCEPWQEEYRDVFELMFLLRGINAVDLLSASSTQVVDGRLEYRRSKVGTLFSVKIEPEARRIIQKYGGEGHLLSPLDRYKDYEDYLHHMNDALKTIGRPLGKRGKVLGKGLFPELSSNWARHSWATAGIALDVPKEVISRGLGHSFGVRVTDTYIDFDERKVDDANRKIIDCVLGLV